MQRKWCIAASFVGAFLLAQQAHALSCISPDMMGPSPTIFTGKMLNLELVDANNHMCTHRMKVRVQEVEKGDLSEGELITVEQRHWICPQKSTVMRKPFRFGLGLSKDGVYTVGMCESLAPNEPRQAYEVAPAHENMKKEEANE